MKVNLTLLAFLCLCLTFSSNAQVGIGTSAPKASLHVANGSAVFSSAGQTGGTAPPPISGAGRRMMWYQEKAAFRAGYVDGTQWDKDYVGDYSLAAGYNAIASGLVSVSLGDYSTASGYRSTSFGYQTLASGAATTAMGYQSKATADYSTALGYMSESSGQYGVAIGSGPKAKGYISIALGYNTEARGSFSNAIGANTVAASGFETAMGSYNTLYTPTDAFGWSGSDRLFVVGNGASASARSDAFTVLKNGNIGIGTSTPGQKAKVEIIGSIPYNIVQGYYYVNSNATGRGSSSVNQYYSLYTSNRIWCGDEINVTSDERTKSKISNSSPSGDLELVKRLNVVDYNYKDHVSKGTTRIKGFLAQEVEQQFPEAVNKTTGFIPDVYAKATQITYDKVSQKLSVTTAAQHRLSKGDRVRLILADGENIATVGEIVSANSFVIRDWATKKPDWIFVYGKEVSDLRNLDYNKLFSAGIGAIQELSIQNENFKTANDRLARELAEFEKQDTEQTDELKATVSRLDQIEALIKANHFTRFK